MGRGVVARGVDVVVVAEQDDGVQLVKSSRTLRSWWAFRKKGMPPQALT